MTSNAPDPPEISVIIPTLKSDEEVACLDYLEAGTFDDYEVLLQNEKGASTARNRGIDRAQADKLVFLDDDSVPAQHYLELASRLLDDHHIITGRIRHPVGGLRDKWISRLAQHYDQGSEPMETDTITGCNMAARASIFDDIGGFDEEMTWGHEETEWVDRAIESGYRGYYHPGLEVHHSYADGIIDYYRKQWKMGEADVYYMTYGEDMIRWYLKDLFNPSRYYRSDLDIMFGVVGAQLLKNVSRLVEIRKRRRGRQ